MVHFIPFNSISFNSEALHKLKRLKGSYNSEVYFSVEVDNTGPKN